jgi:hypothetical protein
MTGEAEKSEAREQQAVRPDRIAREAEQLGAHAHTAAMHFRNREIPRAGAHVLAVNGHLVKLCRLLEDIAVEHAEKSSAAP